jgi:hypothetical protein
LPRLLTAELLGSTALGNGMAHLVLGVPLTVRLERANDHIVLDGSAAASVADAARRRQREPTRTGRLALAKWQPG